MEEADLLRPLRQFVSEAAHAGYERPIFALLPYPSAEKSLTRAVEFRHYLYSRYGVKTLYYPVKEGDEGRTRSFCNAIENLAGSWSQWWQGWQKKPVIRKPDFHMPNGGVMIRHFTNVNSPFQVHKDEEEVAHELNRDARAVIVMGRPGSGKGTLGQTIATGNRLGGYEKRFFATAHFSNDFLCMIDAAANFFGAGTNVLKADGVTSPLKRFEAALNCGRNLFVIGGLERLLVPSSLETALEIEDSLKFEYPLPIGKPLTPEVRDFFEFVKTHIAEADQLRSQSRIVLTSSMWPETLENSRIATVWLTGVPARELVRDERFADLGDEDLVRRLHHTLRGHAYALTVVGSALAARKRTGPSAEDRRQWLDHVVDRLSAVDLGSRAAKAIVMSGRVLLDAKPANLPELESILQRVALFTTPVTPAAVQACYPASRAPSIEDVEAALRYLQQSNLLIEVQYEYDSRFRSTAHTLVRNHVLTRMGYFPSAPGEAHSFEIAGWSSEVPDTLSGPGQGHQLSIQSIDALLNSLQSGRDIDDHQYRHLIRAAFGLIRSRWTATAIPRLSVLEPETTLRLPRPHYDAYQRRLARLLNAIRTRKGMKELWLNERSAPEEAGNGNMAREEIEQQTGVLYADELAWLYNELGLVAFSTGLVADSYALFRAGQHVNAVAERGFHGHRWCASVINLGLVQIERGNLARGRIHLESAVRTAHVLKDKVLEARARGHLGLVHHLMGNYERAEKLYNKAIKELLPIGNHRGASIFLMHRGDLRRRMHKFEKAGNDLRDCVAAAESGRHPDLVHYANLANAKLKRANERNLVALEELTPAIDFARCVGIPRLECDAQIVQGQIALEQGEYDMAGRLAVSSLGIASSLGLRLRLTGGLILLGRVSQARGHWQGAKKLYRAAIELAERQGNQLLIEKGEEALTASRSAERRRWLF
jgi:tetratricopeptide (TPR) repeat protein